MFRARWLVVLAAACGSTPPPASTPIVPPHPDAAVAADAPPATPLALDADLPRLATRATALYQDIASGFAAADKDCAAAITTLRTLQQTYADVIAANAKVLQEDRAADLRAALAPHAQALDAAAQAIMASTTLASCASSQDFSEAFDGLVGAPP